MDHSLDRSDRHDGDDVDDSHGIASVHRHCVDGIGRRVHPTGLKGYWALELADQEPCTGKEEV